MPNKNSKGELTTQQIVMLIILIASFVVILFFFFRLNLGEQTQKDICHNSVILKSKSFVGGELDCRTNYLCVSSSGSEACGEINPTETISVDSNKNEDKKKEIMNALANEMADCWWQFGEGKIDYAGGWGASDTIMCSVCSIVDFDQDTLEGEKITYREFYNHLQKEKKSTSQTYLNYLYGVSSLEGFKEDYLNNEFNLDTEYFILTALSKEGVFSTFISGAKDFATSAPLVSLGIEGWNSFGFGSINSKDEKGKEIKIEISSVVILERKQENFKGCDEFVTKS